MIRPLSLLALLEGLDEGLLQGLLGPHRAFFARLGACPDPSEPAWRQRLAAALQGHDPELPLALQHALLDVSDLATPEGEAELRARAVERGVVLTSPPGRAADTAFRAYFEHRALFRDAHARLGSFAMGLFVNYCASIDRPRWPLSPAGRAALRHGAARHESTSEGAAREAAVTIADFDDEIVVSVRRRAAPRAPSREEGSVMIVFAKATRTLSVNTPDPDEQERLRALLGRVLFGDEGAFAPCRCLSGAPFGERGAGALRASGVEGLATVRLRKLVVQTSEANHLTLGAEADDLADALGPEGRLGEMLRLGDVVHWTFEFFPVGREPFLVEVYPPNQWRLPDRRNAPLVRRFLTQQRFLTAGE